MWDDRIDETARELTNGSPGGDFKARVLERIAQADSPQTHGQHWRWLLPMAAAAAFLVAVAFYYANAGPPVRTTDVAVGQSETPPAPRIVAPATPRTSEVRKPDSERPAIARPGRIEESTVASSFDIIRDANDPDAIVLEPLAMEPIVFDAMEIANTVIPELSVGSIEVPALDQ